MNRRQKIAIVVGAVVCGLLFLFPPWYFPPTTLPGGQGTESRFDAFRWVFADRGPDRQERVLVARAFGQPVSRPDLVTGRVLVFSALCLTALAVFLLRTKSLFRCKRSGYPLRSPPSSSP